MREVRVGVSYIFTMPKIVSVLLLIALKVSCVVASCDAPSVHSPGGIINGTVLSARNGRRFAGFLGIPYAEPPIGDLRFRSPVPKHDWNDTLLAISDIRECPQLRSDGSHAGEEDCLYLNVYTPQVCDGRENLIPIMFYLHGGSFISGSGQRDKWGPEYILDKDVILVVPNYRLGLLGFMTTGDDRAPGNFGLKDQLLALKWVQKNIRSFGGNPEQVTLCGHSAGGMAARYQSMSSKTEGLFHRYIIMAGTLPIVPRFLNVTEYSLYVKRVAESFGCSTNTSDAIMSCLRQMPLSQILNAKPMDDILLPDVYPEYSVTTEPESTDAILVENPDQLEEIDKMADLPLMIGLVQYDGFIATLDMYTNDSLRSGLMRNITGTIRETLAMYGLLSTDADKASQLVKDIRNYYFDTTVPSDKRKACQQMTRFFTDALFAYPLLRMIERHSRRARSPIYVYQFDYRGTFSRTSKQLPSNENIGVHHADELTYLFPALPSRFGLSSGSLSENDEKLVDTMVDLWTSFVIDGAPTSRILTQQWTPYAPNRNYLWITSDANGAPAPTLAANYLEPLLNLWNASVHVSQAA